MGSVRVRLKLIIIVEKIAAVPCWLWQFGEINMRVSYVRSVAAVVVFFIFSQVKLTTDRNILNRNNCIINSCSRHKLQIIFCGINMNLEILVVDFIYKSISRIKFNFNF
jgi:hypothetical protein